MFETFNHAPKVFDAAAVWLEAGDWLVWQLVGGLFPTTKPASLVRSTCQAGYKACWNRQTGFPSSAFLSAVHQKLGDVVETKMWGELRSPGTRAGTLMGDAAELL